MKRIKTLLDIKFLIAEEKAKQKSKDRKNKIENVIKTDTID